MFYLVGGFCFILAFSVFALSCIFICSAFIFASDFISFSAALSIIFREAFGAASCAIALDNESPAIIVDAAIIVASFFMVVSFVLGRSSSVIIMFLKRLDCDH